MINFNMKSCDENPKDERIFITAFFFKHIHLNHVVATYYVECGTQVSQLGSGISIFSPHCKNVLLVVSVTPIIVAVET